MDREKLQQCPTMSHIHTHTHICSYINIPNGQLKQSSNKQAPKHFVHIHKYIYTPAHTHTSFTCKGTYKFDGWNKVPMHFPQMLHIYIHTRTGIHINTILQVEEAKFQCFYFFHLLYITAKSLN